MTAGFAGQWSHLKALMCLEIAFMAKLESFGFHV